jgi:hypothetical protein
MFPFSLMHLNFVACVKCLHVLICFSIWSFSPTQWLPFIKSSISTPLFLLLYISLILWCPGTLYTLLAYISELVQVYSEKEILFFCIAFLYISLNIAHSLF